MQSSKAPTFFWKIQQQKSVIHSANIKANGFFKIKIIIKMEINFAQLICILHENVETLSSFSTPIALAFEA